MQVGTRQQKKAKKKGRNERFGVLSVNTKNLKLRRKSHNTEKKIDSTEQAQMEEDEGGGEGITLHFQALELSPFSLHVPKNISTQELEEIVLFVLK